MNFFQALLVALDNLRVNKLRSFLTLLGIIIGVGTVIIMISIVEGARATVVKQFESIGSNIIYVVYSPEQRQSGEGRGVFEGLTMRDAKAIRQNCPLIATVSPEMRWQAKARHGTNERLVPIIGVTAEVNDVTNIKLARGRRFTEEDEEERRRVCILGPKVAGNLFDLDDPIGKEVVVRDVRLQVIGIMETQGRTFGEERDNFVYVPLSVMHKRVMGTDILGVINCKAVAPDKVEAACDQIWRLLMRYHDKNVRDFVVDSQERVLQAIGRVLTTFTIVLGGIGGLALLVGGIGIMNIMLVSVTERTREIGLRKAVGAKRRDLLVQFLIESTTLSGFGGIFGILFGGGLSWLVGLAMGERLPTHVPLWACLLSFSFAAGVGIFFGIYPAYRAATLDPISALRYE